MKPAFPTEVYGSPYCWAITPTRILIPLRIPPGRISRTVISSFFCFSGILLRIKNTTGTRITAPIRNRIAVKAKGPR